MPGVVKTKRKYMKDNIKGNFYVVGYFALQIPLSPKVTTPNICLFLGGIGKPLFPGQNAPDHLKKHHINPLKLHN